MFPELQKRVHRPIKMIAIGIDIPISFIFDPVTHTHIYVYVTVCIYNHAFTIVEYIRVYITVTCILLAQNSPCMAVLLVYMCESQRKRGLSCQTLTSSGVPRVVKNRKNINIDSRTVSFETNSVSHACKVHRWISFIRIRNAELWCVLWWTPEQTVEQTAELLVIFCDVTWRHFNDQCHESIIQRSLSQEHRWKPRWKPDNVMTSSEEQKVKQII